MMQGHRSLPSQPEMCEGFVIEGAAEWVTIRGAPRVVMDVDGEAK
jgi:hypothetical protein